MSDLTTLVHVELKSHDLTTMCRELNGVAIGSHPTNELPVVRTHGESTVLGQGHELSTDVTMKIQVTHDANVRWAIGQIL